MNDAYPPPAPPPPPPSYYPPPPSGGGNGGPRLPWDERSQIGFPNALIETLKLLVTAPGDAFSRLRPDGDYFGPILFGGIFYWVGMIFGQIWSLLLGNAMMSMIPGEFGQQMGAYGAGQGVVSAVIWIIFAPVLYLIGLFIASGILHLCLMLVGGLERSPLGFEGTLKVAAYSSVTNLASVIPIVGGLIAMIASLILLTVGLTQAHKTTQGKALMAVLIPVAICCVCIVIGAVFFGAAIAGLMANAG